MKPSKLNLLVIVFVNLFMGCSSTPPHTNFRQIMGSAVGHSIDDPPTQTKAYPQRLVATKILDNGNEERRFLFRRSCSYMLEIDKFTRIIVRWRFEGTEEDCFILPV